MFTSRAEFRLHLRIDNADRRLTPHGRRVGLISDAAWADFQAKQERLDPMKKLLEERSLTPECWTIIAGDRQLMWGQPPSAVRPSKARQADHRSHADDWPSAIGQSLAQLLKRPEITIEHLVPVLRELAPEFFERRNPCIRASVVDLSSEVRNELKSVETEIKYAGYLLQQQRAMERLKKSEQHSIPDWFDYRSVSGLSREMQEKLIKVRPRTIGHASRIPGVTPAAVSLVQCLHRNPGPPPRTGGRDLDPVLRREVFLRVLRVLCG